MIHHIRTTIFEYLCIVRKKQHIQIWWLTCSERSTDLQKILQEYNIQPNIWTTLCWTENPEFTTSYSTSLRKCFYLQSRHVCSISSLFGEKGILLVNQQFWDTLKSTILMICQLFSLFLGEMWEIIPCIWWEYVFVLGGICMKMRGEGTCYGLLMTYNSKYII